MRGTCTIHLVNPVEENVERPVLIASALLWVPLLAREARSHETERPPSTST